ncbi:GNAT family N-acetyltransferase [Cohnella lubricantis]|uniref:GNAT family N-acetyltransferase n=1 Tax=Cohnella lubricantis TaxID=2163172 RepID=A0A841TFS2_9BACL|nr:GNAT family N-acetyltransferase [Cohnella lubricantis]MBB6678945.1 GNAT family N-acetyltransferase [Cohnella lubricantis]MBP2118837.1 ribosomal protein S18 acetylase RimI-like enzyme [Cohnella lubricantis]
MRAILNPWLKLREGISQEDYEWINRLQDRCVREDQIALKLELDYKLGAASSTERTGIRRINEFMYFDGPDLIGYMGICEFGGASTPLEVHGMVHPEYRRQGVFTTLSRLVMAEWKSRAPKNMLLLSDRKSEAGQAFIQATGARYHHSEHEMYLRADRSKIDSNLEGVTLRKATNADAPEIYRQNAIYFGEELGEAAILPEEEEKKGMTIYLAEKDRQVIGKVHLQLSSGIGGIYGLGVLPEHRGKGYGRATLLKAIDRLKEAHAEDIMLQVAVENANALRLYQSCGFAETSTMDYYECQAGKC